MMFLKCHSAYYLLFCQELIEVMPGFAIGAGDVELRTQTGGLFVGAVLAHTDLWP